MRRDQVMALVASHYERDEQRFRGLVLQIAAGIKDAYARERLRAFTNKPEFKVLELSPDVQKLVWPLAPRDLDSLSLPGEVRSMFALVAEEHQAREAFERAGLSPTSRLLFHGPPGNGKTSAAAALCGLLGIDAFGMSLHAVVDSYMGETNKKLRMALTALGEARALVLDELDAVAETRSGSDGGGSTREKNLVVSTLLTLFDRESRGLLIATTNRLDMIDPAVVRRFDQIIEFPAPKDEAKIAFAWRLADRFEVKLSQAEDEAVLDCESFDAVERLVVGAARRAIVARWKDERGREAAE